MNTANSVSQSLADAAETAANAATREVHAISQGVAQQGRRLGREIAREGAVVSKRAGELFDAAGRTTREHPWAAAGIAIAAVAFVGGLMWARRR